MKPATDNELLKAVGKWVSRVGRSEAIACLVRKGVGTTTAERLASGRYDSRPSPLLRSALADLMAEQEQAS